MFSFVERFPGQSQFFNPFNGERQGILPYTIILFFLHYKATKQTTQNQPCGSKQMPTVYCFPYSLM